MCDRLILHFPNLYQFHKVALDITPPTPPRVRGGSDFISTSLEKWYYMLYFPALATGSISVLQEAFVIVVRAPQDLACVYKHASSLRCSHYKCKTEMLPLRHEIQQAQSADDPGEKWAQVSDTRVRLNSQILDSTWGSGDSRSCKERKFNKFNICHSPLFPEAQG